MTIDDVVIIGSGVAALQLAAHLGNDKNVRVLTKSKIRMANSYLAQGGIAAAIGTHDHPAKHLADTLEAGRFHNDKESVREIIYAAPELIHAIALQGDVFDRSHNGELLLGMEGAHSEHRIIHGGGDATGKNVMEFLIGNLPPNVKIEEDVFAYELLVENNRCTGVKGKQPDGSIEVYWGSHIVIATGGCGQLYSYTSNANTVSGDGIALAYLAGAEIADMEFIQFHPTLLYINGETKGLVSEAVRGEGAILVTDDGTRIMEGVHRYKDLAPRHVVSQTIYEYLKKGQQVYLDISSIQDFQSRFPSITALCEANGIDLSTEKIPVAPGSHFLMGGIKTDLTGRTSIDGLYAIGEAACTGLHGANRLASNSLLEGLYQGKKLAEWIKTAWVEPAAQNQPTLSFMQEKIALPNEQQLKEYMMERVGIVRNEVNLKKQKKWLNQFIVTEIADSFSVQELTKIFMVLTAKLITESALKRTESRGGHYRSDYPLEDDQNWLQRTIIHKKKREVKKDHEHIKTALTT